MGTTFMITEISKTSEPHKFVFNLTNLFNKDWVKQIQMTMLFLKPWLLITHGKI